MTSGAGSSILKLCLGKNYARTDRPGVFTLIRFESSLEVQVREFGSGNVDVVPVSVIHPLRSVPKKPRGDVKELAETEKWKTAEQKYEAIKDLIPLNRISKAMWEATATKHDIKIKRLRKWLALWRAHPVMSSLMRKQREDAGEPRLHPFVEARVNHYLEALRTNGDLQMSDIMEDLDHDIDIERKKTSDEKLVTPVVSTLYQRWTQYSEIDKAEGRIGAKKARQKYGLVRGSLQDADHPLSIVQCDHLEIPVMIVDEEFRIAICRPWITVLIDLFSRMIYGYYISLESPGNLSLGLAISHAILPKKDMDRLPYKATWPIAGVPWQIHADNAGEFQGNMLEWAGQEYGFEITFRKVKEPQYGAYIESYLGTLSSKLRRIPGSTREGPEALGDKNPADEAVMTLAELDAYVLNLFAEYHINSHSGLADATPLAQFQGGMRGNAMTYPVGELYIPDDPVKLMLDLLPPVERAVSPPGVVIDYIWYMDDCLQRWVDAKKPNESTTTRMFLFRQDPRDLTRIYFWDPDEKTYYMVRTRNILRAAISKWEYNAVRKYLSDKGVEHVDEDIIFNARDERRRLLSAAIAKTKAARNARETERNQQAEQGAAAFQAKVASTESRSYRQAAANATASGVRADIDVSSPAAPFVMDWDN
jgi:putative transposase